MEKNTGYLGIRITCHMDTKHNPPTSTQNYYSALIYTQHIPCQFQKQCIQIDAYCCLQFEDVDYLGYF